MIKVAIVNASTAAADADVTALAYALQIQVRRDFAPAWGIDAQLRGVLKGETPAADEWILAILDDADQAGALGYHDVTREGLPLGKVFAKTAMNYGASWTVTASHELLEMLGDPEIDLSVFQQRADGGLIYSYEVCDPCEDDRFGYRINGTLVSDFVFPAWFQQSRAPLSTQFDFCRYIRKPFELLAGGYISIYDIKSGRGWTQLTAEAVNFRARPPVGSRRECRTIPHDQRIRSSVITPA